MKRMFKEVSVDGKRLVLLFLLLFVFVTFAGFSVTGQENDGLDMVSEIVESDEVASEGSGVVEDEDALELVVAGESEHETVEETVIVGDDSGEVFLPLDSVLAMDDGAVVENDLEIIADEDSDAVFVSLDDVTGIESGSSGGGSGQHLGNYVKDEAVVEEISETADGEIVFDGLVDSTDSENDVALVPYVLFRNGVKEIETMVEEGSVLEINKEEDVTVRENEWHKRLTVSSDEHFDRELTVYVAIMEAAADAIRVYWVQEDRDMTAQTAFYDTNGDGFVDRISFPVAHLSTQEFDITVSFSEGDSSAENLTLERLQVPDAIISDPDADLVFDFTISYNNTAEVYCELNITNSSNVDVYHYGALISEGFGSVMSGLMNDTYDWNVYCYDQTLPEQNDSDQDSFDIALDYAPQISFSSDVTTIQEDEAVTFITNVGFIHDAFMNLHIDFGDGDIEYYGAINLDESNDYSFSDSVPHVYDEEGDYTAKAYVTIIDGVDTYVGNSNPIEIEVTNSTFVDEEGPTIDLIKPANNKVLTGDSDDLFNFTYSVHDPSGIESCTFNLYYFNTSDLGELVYDTETTSIANDGEIGIALVDFDKGEYTWEVECVDTLDNKEDKSRDFIFTFPTEETEDDEQQSSQTDTEPSGDFERAGEIDELMDAINEFLIESGKYDREEKAFLEDLGIVEDLVFYKKKLSQIKLDLGKNIEFIRDESAREQRRQEIHDEIDEIREKTILSVVVLGSEEHIKNSIDTPFDEVVDAYISANNLVVSRNARKQLSQYNQDLQNILTVGVTARHVEVQYFDRTKEYTVITKEPTIKEEHAGSFIEVIPKTIAADVADITFVNEYSVLAADPIVEIAQADLQEGKIVYYVEGLVTLKEAELTDLLVFEETIPEGFSAFTGFSVLLDSATSGSGFALYLSWILAIMVFLVGGFFAVRHVQTQRLVSGTEAKILLGIVRDTEQALSQKDITRAKDNYTRLQELYTTLAPDVKGAVYKKIASLRVSIDKKEVGALMQECIAALREGRKEQALVLYQDIQLIHNRMPIKYQKKIREKMLPYVYLFKR